MYQTRGVEIDVKEKETKNWFKKACTVKLPKEMGNFQRIHVDASTKSVTCNCHKCNKDGPRCFWVDTIRCLQFGHTPDIDMQECRETALGWENIIKEARSNIRFYALD